MARKVKLMIHLDPAMKAKIDALKAQGFTASGFIRAVLEREFAHPQQPAVRSGQKGR